MAVGRLRSATRRFGVTALSAMTLGLVSTGAAAPALSGAAVHPTVSDFQIITQSETPPTEAQCFSVGRRCFTPSSMQNSYNLGPLYALGDNGAGRTIAIIDSFGTETIKHDLHVFDTAFGLQAMCGEEGVTCQPGMPNFSIVHYQGDPPPKAPPPNNGTGQEAHNLWALEVALDVEWSHAIAPMANIVLVTTPTAETLGVQGFHQMMNAEEQVIQNHQADVISQSFGSGEDAFDSPQSLLNLRYAFKDAQAAGITVLASSGDSGTAEFLKNPPKDPKMLPFPGVDWPASDPLVTGVGGTYLCTDPITGTGVDSTDPPVNCQNNPGIREIGWIASGGGFSHVFSRPSYQDNLPAGSTPIPSDQRGVPDIAYQASSRTGVLVYITEPGYTGLPCPDGNPCSLGWYDVGGTSSGSPQWAGLVAIADQINGGPLGFINPALYKIANNPAQYANDFYDVTTGNNGEFAPTIPGYPATTGWDPVTGLGTPNAATLLPDLVAASH
jgi:subtilase family serine protease